MIRRNSKDKNLQNSWSHHVNQRCVFFQFNVLLYEAGPMIDCSTPLVSLRLADLYVLWCPPLYFLGNTPVAKVSHVDLTTHTVTRFCY